MKAYVISRMNGTHPRGFRVPKLYDYMRGFEVKASTSEWSVCIVDDSTLIPPEAEADPDIFVFDTEAELDTVLTTPKRNAVNNELALTGWEIDGVPISVVSGDTVRMVLEKIRMALDHSSWGL